MTTVLSNKQMFESTASLPASSQKLRILFLAPFAPNLQAGHGGGRVIAELISRLAQRNAVGLCYLRSENEPAVENILRERCDVIEEVVLPQNSLIEMNRSSHRLHVLNQLLEGKPLWAIDRYSEAYERKLKGLLKTWRPDVIQIEFHIMGQYLPVLINYPAPRILIQHEPGTRSAHELLRTPFSRGRIMPLLDLLAWERFERQITRQVDAVVVFTERDRIAIRELGQTTPIVQMPLGTEISEKLPNPVTQDPLSLLFVGNFKHPPNLDAAKRLIHHIFPKVQAQIPGSRLFIVGDHLPDSILEHANENVISTGYVPDVAPYLNRAALVIVPLRFGGGMRVKVLEALAAGKAVVASERAVEGLELVNGQQVIIAEEDEEFVITIIDLLRDAGKRLMLGTQARAWVSTNLSWRVVADVYEKLYRSLLKC